MLPTVMHNANSTAFTPHNFDLEMLSKKAQYDLLHHRLSATFLNHFYPEKRTPSGAMRT